MNDSLEFCVGCFLRYRSFPNHVSPIENKRFFNLNKTNVVISNKNDLDAYLSKVFENVDIKNTGIMLSGGIDSALLASYMPSGTIAFTLSYPESKNRDEVERARFFADKFNLKLVIVEVTFDDVINFQDELMIHKGQPLSSIEIGIYKMCLEAKKYNLKKLVTGMGADGIFGGTFNLMSRDWTNEEFVDRFTYIKPEIIMHNPPNTLMFFEKYYSSPYFDMYGFLDDVESEYTLSYFLNPCELAEIELVAPYESCVRNFELDRIGMISGKEKILLRNLFKEHNGFDFVGIKYAFPRPIDYWSKMYDESLDSLFIKDAYSKLSNYEQQWILYTTNHFVKLFKRGLIK